VKEEKIEESTSSETVEVVNEAITEESVEAEEENVTVLKGSRQRGRSDNKSRRKRPDQEEKPVSEWTEKLFRFAELQKL